MSVARNLERRLENLLDKTGKMFSGRLHISEIASKLAREADLARFEHVTGPATANRYAILMNPRDLEFDTDELAGLLAAELEDHAAEAGFRLEGPLTVTIETSEEVAAGDFICHVEVEPGEQTPWARLVGEDASFEIGRNRTVVGRSASADTVIPHQDVSRRHVLIWRESGVPWIRDLGSANGTAVNHRPIGSEVARLSSGALVSLADHQYRFEDL